MFDNVEKRAQEHRQRFLRSVSQVDGWKIRVTLSASEVFSICKVLCRSLDLDTALRKQCYRIFSCDEEKDLIRNTLKRLLMTHRRSSSHLDNRMLHPNYNDQKWHGDLDDILYTCVSPELLNIDLGLMKFKIDKEKAKNVIEELRK